MLKPKANARIRRILSEESTRTGLKVMKFVNVGNHLHLIVLPKNKRLFNRFLRAFCGRVARAVLGAEKGSPKGSFWDLRPFSRIIEWGKDLDHAMAYLFKNVLEANGWFELAKEYSPGGSRRCPRASRRPGTG